MQNQMREIKPIPRQVQYKPTQTQAPVTGPRVFYRLLKSQYCGTVPGLRVLYRTLTLQYCGGTRTTSTGPWTAYCPGYYEAAGSL
eukprot:2030804-Rhodomonas_salina.1